MDSFISWKGGKKLLRKAICERFPQDAIEKYVEVFGGAGWVLFHKPKHAKLEVYNDINSHLVNLFKCVKYHPKAIIEELENLLYSRETFTNFKENYKSKHLTDIQRAAIYFYLIRFSFGANVTCFGASKSMRGLKNLDYLFEIKERLKGVVIENKSYEALIKQYDRPHTLFCCDPPYYGTEQYYDHSDTHFDKFEHAKLAQTLKNMKGKFIISYNNDIFIKELYKNFNIEEIARQNNLSPTKGKEPYRELIIKNY